MRSDRIHNWFGLTYASYLVMPRLALQEMPDEWQRRFVELLEEWEATGFEPPNYHVLRDDDRYTRVESYDEDDPESRPWVYHVIDDDPLREYKYPDKTLLEEIRSKVRPSD